MKRLYVLLSLSGLYALNRFLLIPGLGRIAEQMQAAEALYRLFASYGADILAGAWILCFLNLLLVWSGCETIRRMMPAVLFVLGCGIFWEYITPLYLSRSVADPWDIAAYLLGGCIYMVIEKRYSERRWKS